MDDAAQLGDERLDQQGIGGDDCIILRQWCCSTDGVDALVDEVGVADVVLDEEGA
jgi:hypothetical protein